MARTNLPLTNLTADNGIQEPAGTTVDPVNGMNVQIPSTGIPAQYELDGVILLATNTAAVAENIIIDAGVLPPAHRAGLGPLTLSVAAGKTEVIGPLSSARFSQSDGSLNIDFAAGFTGTIIALMRPSRW
jgi:hypothetical protein